MKDCVPANDVRGCCDVGSICSNNVTQTDCLGVLGTFSGTNVCDGAGSCVIPTPTPTATPTVTPTSTNTATPTSTLAPRENSGGDSACDDGIDNDGDGAIDCVDSECLGVAPCVAPAPAISSEVLVLVVVLLIAVGAVAMGIRRRTVG